MRRNIRDMPFERRQDGFSALERLMEGRSMRLALGLLAVVNALPVSFFIRVLFLLAILIMNQIHTARHLIWNVLDPINQANNNRLIQSFSETDCWRHLRYRKIDLPRILTAFNLPDVIDCGNGMHVTAEYTFLIF